MDSSLFFYVQAPYWEKLLNRLAFQCLKWFVIYLNTRGISKQVAAEILKMEVPSMARLSLKLFLEEIDLINKQLKELESEYLKIEETKNFSKNFKIIQSVLGVGPLIAASLAFEVGDWKRFSNEKQVAAFLGLTPSEYSSGESIHRGRITGQGNPTLRMYLVQASWYLIGKDENMKLFFERIAKQSGSKKKAIVAVARKLICKIYSMIKNEREYEVCLAA